MLGLTIALALVAASNACSRLHNFGGGGGVTVGSPNIPAPPPPTPQPTPPPPPPPLPQGWQTPAFKQDTTPVQKQTRTNCKRAVKLVNVGTADNVEIEEIWEYTCSFNVYIQTEIAPTDHPQHCGCSLAYSRESDAEADAMYESAYSTTITDVNVVSFDPVRAVVNEIFPEFSHFRLNDNLTNHLADSASTASMDYSMAMASFSDLVEPVTIENWPASLDMSNPENTNNIAALCFAVEEVYRTEFSWPAPPIPTLAQQPNAWRTNCIPWDFKFLAAGSAKRQTNLATTLWWTEFMTFPTTDTFATTSGFNPAARLFRSFYRTSDCQVATSTVTFASEFRFLLSHETTYDIHGAFAFFRQYKSMEVVGGAPLRFHAGATMSFTGFIEVDWHEPYSRDENNAYRAGVAGHMMLGTPATGANLATPFIGATEDTKVCQSVPQEWIDCQDPANCDSVSTTNVYSENVVIYQLKSATGEVLLSNPATFDCAPAYTSCTQETTFLSAINAGLNARDFTIRSTSQLAIGLRSDLCTDYPSIPAFDSVTFHAIQSGVELQKRSVGQIASTELPAHIKFMKRQGAVDRRVIVPPASAQGDPAVGKPEVRDVVVQAGGGSADESGLPAGDHPVQLFPETYAVPVSLDPEDIENDITHGRRVNVGVASCVHGSQGCACRSRRGRPRCDAPLTCSGGDDFPADVNVEPTEGYCQLPTCLAGEAGCECTSDDGCASDNLSCESSTCVFVQRCTPGENGCKCNAGSCLNGICNTNDNVCVAYDCPPGMAGCECREHGSDGSKYCFAEQGYKTPLVLEATQDYTAVNANEWSFAKGDEVIVTDRANIDPQGDGIWIGAKAGSTEQKDFPASVVAVSPGAQFEIVNEYTCQDGAVCQNADADAGTLGGACNGGTTCEANLVCDTDNNVCMRPRCEPGSSGCSCTSTGTCASADDECNPNGVCVTPTCSLGEGGCACSLGQCEAGFTCDKTTFEAEGRCVKERCPAGARGCACKVEADNSLSCIDDGFECQSLKVDGSDKRCVAKGKECGNQLERCVEFCGAGLVKDCPPCSNQIPLCITPDVAVDSSATTMAIAMFALVAAVMALF